MTLDKLLSKSNLDFLVDLLPAISDSALDELLSNWVIHPEVDTTVKMCIITEYKRRTFRSSRDNKSC